MHKLVTLAAVVVLAASSANCSRDNSSEGASATVTGPSATEARGGKGGSGTGGGGSTGGSGSLTLVMVNDVNGNRLPNWGDSIRFDVSTSATTEPHVSVTCSQNGAVVYGAQTGYYAGYPWPWTQVMKLSSTAWQSGSASCVARLYSINGTSTTTITTSSFTAYE